MTVKRRRVLQALPAAVLLGVAGRVEAATTDLVVLCETTLGPALNAAGTAFTRRSGARVRVFPTAPGLVLPQLTHTVQNDIVVAQLGTLDLVAQAGLLASRGDVHWRNRLVIAGPSDKPAGDKSVAVTDGRFVVPDPSAASDFDGPALLARLGLHPKSLLGVIDTDEAAYLLATGGADAGFLHMTDVRADPRLRAIGPVPDQAHPPISYAVGITRLARRPDPAAFVDFLTAPAGTSLLADQGLEHGE